MHRAAHCLVPAEGEREVRKPARSLGMRARGLDLAAGFDEVEAIAVMLFNAGGYRKDVGVKDDILGREADTRQQFVSARANLDLAVLGVSLPRLVKGHHHNRRAIGHAFARLLQERLFALFHADGVDDGLARNAFQPRLNHIPFRAVDHHRNPRNVRFGCDQLEEGRHRFFSVEQPLVHIDVDHLRAVFNLLAGHLDSGGIIIRHDELFEPRRASDIGALANIDETGG